MQQESGKFMLSMKNNLFTCVKQGGGIFFICAYSYILHIGMYTFMLLCTGLTIETQNVLKFAAVVAPRFCIKSNYQD